MAITGRLYTVGFQNVTVAAVQDLFAVFTPAGKIIGIQQINLGQITGVSVVNARLRLRYLPPTATPGTGGTISSSGLINKVNAGDAASGCTAGYNNTSQASSSGTIVDLVDDIWNTINGYVWYPPIPGRPLIIPVSSGFVVSLDTALASYVCSGSLTFEELS